MTEGLQLTIPKRLFLLRLVLVAGVCVSVLISMSLWGGQRHFPLSPLFDTPVLLPPFDLIYPVLFILLLSGSLVMRNPRVLLTFALVLAGWMVCMDVLRLQAWFVVYCSLLSVFVFYNGRVDDANRFTSYFILMQIVVASVYFFSGIDFLFFHPVEKEFAAIIQPLQRILSQRQFELFLRFSVAVPYLLMFIGLAFIISPIRYLAIFLSVLMHLSLLFFIFPGKTQPYYALWFSNLVFIFLVFLLFSGKTKQRYFSPTFLFQRPLFYIVIVVAVILPAFRLWTIHPNYSLMHFSFTEANHRGIPVSAATFTTLSAFEAQFCTKSGDHFILNTDEWAAKELHSFHLPNEIVTKNLLWQIRHKGGSAVKEDELEKGIPGALLSIPAANSIFASNFR